MAFFITTIVVLICFLLAFTAIDFTKFIIYIVIATLVLVVFSLVVTLMMVVFNEKFTFIRLIICLAMTLAHSIMFIIEIQMVIGGKTVALGEDDYVLGAYLLYTSILQLFFDMLRCVMLLEELT
ncbi:uncharacterized protein [Choristoneura fumiferana]|uniref:uncharacterized protein n=1 Tax=Choristoneura fumiferana TaxID=7141 RepID=UPI003D15523E